MPLPDETLRAWLAYQGAGPDEAEKRRSELAWAQDQLDDLLYADPEEAWGAVTALIELAESDWQLVNVAAGPLESLLFRHPTLFAERVDRSARRDPKFRRCLSGVWLGEDSPLYSLVRKYASSVAEPL